MGKSKGKTGGKKAKRRLTAHRALRDTLEVLIERARGAAYRVVCAQPDPEAVHDFRVALRRMRTVLRASRKTYGKARVKAIEGALAAFGDATGALRDAEVLAETLGLCTFEGEDAEAVDRWLALRRARESQLREGAIATLLGTALEETFAEVSAMLAEGPRRDETLVRFARRRLEDAREEVASALPVPADDIDALHRLRIRFKRLRYVGEMLQELLADLPEGDRRGLRKPLRRTIKGAARMQKLLGQLHDTDAALEALHGEPLGEADRAWLARGLSTSRDRLVASSFQALAALPEVVVGTADLVVPR